MAFRVFLLQLLGQSCTSAVCPGSFLCAWCQKLHCRGLVVLMTLDGLVMVAPSVRVSARDWDASFVSVCSNSECQRNGCQNLTCRGCPVSCSGSFSTWGSVLQSMRQRSSVWRRRLPCYRRGGPPPSRSLLSHLRV